MQLVESSVEFYMGAATTGQHKDKWTWPGRDLPYLYQCKWAACESSLDPDMETWKKYGLVKAYGKDSGWRLISFNDFVNYFGEERVKRILIHCRSTYLKESKDVILDELGAPK